MEPEQTGRSRPSGGLVVRIVGGLLLAFGVIVLLDVLALAFPLLEGMPLVGRPSSEGGVIEFWWVTGWLAHVFHAVMGAAFIFAGTQLLRLRRSGWIVALLVLTWGGTSALAYVQTGGVEKSFSVEVEEVGVPKLRQHFAELSERFRDLAADQEEPTFSDMSDDSLTRYVLEGQSGTMEGVRRWLLFFSVCHLVPLAYLLSEWRRFFPRWYRPSSRRVEALKVTAGLVAVAASAVWTFWMTTEESPQQSQEEAGAHVEGVRAEEPVEDVEELRPIDRQLFEAVDRSDVQAVSACLAQGANVNARNESTADYETALEGAACQGDCATAKVLIEAGADLNAGLPLHVAVLEHDKDMVELLARSGADLALRDGRGETALQNAIERGYTDIVEVLVQSGGVTDIFMASGLGEVERVRKLLEEDPGLAQAHDTVSVERPTALHRAAHYGHTDVVRLLLAHGAGVNGEDASRATPLYKAVCAGHQQVARLLLERGADTNAATEWDDTPLHAAARNGDVAMVKMLLANGADVAAKNRDGPWLFDMVPPGPGSGLTPLGVALKKGHNEVADLLRQHGAKE